MSDLPPPAPRIQCDNCGFIADKSFVWRAQKHHTPCNWGTIEASSEGGEGHSYPEDIPVDLCPGCFKAAFDALTDALRGRRP